LEGDGVTWLNSALEWTTTLALQFAVVLLGFGVERLRPARQQGLAEVRLNLAYIAALRVIYAGLYPLSAALTTVLVNQLGGGLITLPESGLGLVVAIPCYALAMDGGEYAFHRAQHRFPLLWAMHSLHHSDPAVNVSTAARHFWGEMPLKFVTVYALVGLIFKANPIVIGVYTGLGMYNYFLHMNLRIGFGRWSAWLNSPQFHRLHHSALPEHHDCNFNQFFPIFDVLFGTFRQPQRDEYPPTGLTTGELPLRLYNMLLWPWRRPQPVLSRDQTAPYP
jgi:sterol desaturase/sphingolipid hydroxylase (fatty acid hydroxylase superfamily)